MKMDDIRSIARDRGVTPGKLSKVHLIRTIQQTEGNSDCFATVASAETCDQHGCLWREDCFSTAKKNHAA